MRSPQDRLADERPNRRPPAEARRLGRRLGRGALWGLAALLVLALSGATAQVIAERRAAAAHPPPGELVRLPDGRMLHLHVEGRQHTGPTVLLLGGAGASSAAWAWIQPPVAERYRVVAYDRAGLGWSDASPRPPTAPAVLDDLRTALRAQGLTGPYVLVGHSLGGHYARAFAIAHPDEVIGMVLVDPSHEDQTAALDGASDPAGMKAMFTALRLATGLGLTRIYNPFEADLHGLPEPSRSQVLAEVNTVGYVRAMAAEFAAMDDIGAAIADGHLGDIPLRVLIAGGASTEDGQRQVDTLRPLRERLAQLSTNGQLTHLPTAQHVTIVSEQRHAAQVARAILDVAESGNAESRTG